MFSGHTELYKSDSPSEAFTLARSLESCFSYMKVWVVQNKLQLNDDKTEICRIGSARKIILPSSIFSLSSNPACNLYVIFYSQLALKERVNKFCQFFTWRPGGSVQSDSIFLLKPPTLLFSLLFSLGLIIVILLLALHRFPLMKLRQRSTAQFASSTKLLSLPTSLFYDFHWLPVSNWFSTK